MQNNNLILVTHPTHSLLTNNTTLSINPIGIALAKIARYYDSKIVDRIKSDFYRGDATSAGIIEDFLKGNVPFIHRPLDAISVIDTALQHVSKLFSPPEQYRPVHFADLRFYPWELSTSVEEPFRSDPKFIAAVQQARRLGLISSEAMTKNTLYNAAFGTNRTIIHTIKSQKLDLTKRPFFYDAIAHARSHLTGIEDDAKIRMVFGITWLFLMVELMLLWPLMNWLRKGFTPIAWTYEIMTGGMAKINKLTKPNDLYLCLDWKQFDKRIQYDLIDKIHNLWKSWMKFDDGYIPTVIYPDSSKTHSEKDFKIRIERLWTWMNTYIKDMHIQLPDGSRYQKKYAGIPSGALQTQILGSFLNLLMLISCLLYIGFPLPEISLVLGDDSLLIIRSMGHVSTTDLFNSIQDAASKLFGGILNITKSKITNDPNQIIFLGYQNQNGTPIRDEIEMLAKLVHPERKWNSSRAKARALGFAYANCGVNPKVHKVCEEIFHGLSHVDMNEKGSPFLRFYKEYCGEYNANIFPDRKTLLDQLFTTPDRRQLDERFFPKWFFTSDY